MAVTVLAAGSSAQWLPQHSGTTARLRGVSAASGNVAWASGSGGTHEEVREYFGWVVTSKFSLRHT